MLTLDALHEHGSSGQGQGELSTHDVRTTTTATGEVQTTTAPNERRRRRRLVPTEGAVQVAIRGGNPLQMLNPARRREYGTAQEHVSHDPNDPGKPKGIVAFRLELLVGSIG